MAIPDGYRVIKKTDVLSTFIAVTVKRETDCYIISCLKISKFGIETDSILREAKTANS